MHQLVSHNSMAEAFTRANHAYVNMILLTREIKKAKLEEVWLNLSLDYFIIELANLSNYLSNLSYSQILVQKVW